MSELDMRSAPSLGHSRGASHLSANRTLALDDPAQAWVVEEGDVLVFAIEVLGEQASGERHQLGEFGPGDALLGIGLDPRARVALLATGVGDAWVRRVSLVELCRREAEGASGIERWVTAMWQRLVRARYVPTGLRVLPDEGAISAAASDALHPSTGVTWVASRGGGFTLAGDDAAMIEEGL